MDIFVEHMIKRKRRPVDYVIMTACFLGSILAALLGLIGMSSFLGPISLLLGFVAMYLLYQIFISVNVEFEYCFTNGALDVDKIYAARRRKRVTELNARHIEIMGTVKNSAFKGYMENKEIKKIFACTAANDEDVYFVVYTDKDGKRLMLLFNPEETIKDGFRRLNPQKVFLED